LFRGEGGAAAAPFRACSGLSRTSTSFGGSGTARTSTSSGPYPGAGGRTLTCACTGITRRSRTAAAAASAALIRGSCNRRCRAEEQLDRLRPQFYGADAQLHASLQDLLAGRVVAGAKVVGNVHSNLHALPFGIRLLGGGQDRGSGFHQQRCRHARQCESSELPSRKLHNLLLVEWLPTKM
jgi:hypothetical protein